MNRLKVKHIVVDGNSFKIEVVCEDAWKKFVRGDFWVSYECNISNVPKSILIIPFLCNILPIAWVFNFEIEIDEIDELFYESIPRIKNGYEAMYPDLDLGGKIIAHKLIDNDYRTDKVGVLYSGGVDAATTVFRHIEENPDLITVFGSDIKLNDKDGIERVSDLNRCFAENHALEYKQLFSNFRSFVNERALDHHSEIKKHKYGWWHDFQHGIGLIGLVAPISYVYGYKTVYIASSFHKSQQGMYTCASDPTIDNMLKYGSTNTFHDGYELTRQDKIHFLCDCVKRYNLRLYLRVCWRSSGGENCCHCEKCRRTYLAILAEKNDPADFGLNFSESQYKAMAEWYKKHLEYRFEKSAILRYKPIQDTFFKNYTIRETPSELLWFRDVDICSKKYPFYVSVIDKIRRKMGKE